MRPGSPYPTDGTPSPKAGGKILGSPTAKKARENGEINLGASNARLLTILVILVSISSAGVAYFAGYQRGVESHGHHLESTKNWIHAIEDAADRAAHSIHLPHLGGNSDDSYKPIPTMRHRGEIAQLVQSEGIHKVGVELGVQYGSFAEHNIRVWKDVEVYYLVDLWAPQEHYVDNANRNQKAQDEILNTVRERLLDNPEFGHKVRALRNSTIEASTLFAPNSVDFVYVDARHDYDGVMQDLEAWWPKIRKGGIMAGHDYLDSTEVDQWMHCTGPIAGTPRWSNWCHPCKPEVPNSCMDFRIASDGSVRHDDKAVRSAVNEFAATHNRQVQVTYRDPFQSFYWESWLIRK